MKSIAILCLLLVAVVRGICPYYEGAVHFCHDTKAGDLCSFWECVATHCHTADVIATFQQRCGNFTGEYRPLPTEYRVRRSVNLFPPKLRLGTPEVNSPCTGDKGAWTVQKIQSNLLATAMDGYYDRANEHYTEGGERWSGITGKVCPSKAPPYSDCSSFVTWIYWTLFGNGPDFLNAESWSAGYTGTLVVHGVQVPANVNSLEVGDLCFYYQPMHHVAIYVGGGKVVTHGEDPVGYSPWDYAPVDYCRRYI